MLFLFGGRQFQITAEERWEGNPPAPTGGFEPVVSELNYEDDEHPESGGLYLQFPELHKVEGKLTEAQAIDAGMEMVRVIVESSLTNKESKKKPSYAQAKVLTALAEFGLQQIPKTDNKGNIFVEVTDATIAKITELKGAIFFVASDAGVSRGG